MTTLKSLDGFQFIAGKGSVEDQKLCIMSAVAYVAGEPHTDHPVCACPVLTAAAIRINDAGWWSSTEERTDVLLPLVARLVGTRTGDAALRARRRDVLVDAVFEDFVPEVLTRVGLPEQAEAVRTAPKSERRTTANAAAAYANAANATYAAYAAADAANAANAADAAARAANAADAAAYAAAYAAVDAANATYAAARAADAVYAAANAADAAADAYAAANAAADAADANAADAAADAAAVDVRRSVRDRFIAVFVRALEVV